MATKMWWRSTPGIPDSSSSGMPPRQLEPCDHLVDRGKPDALRLPVSGARHDIAVIEPARGVRDETNLPAPLEKSADSRVVADVRRDAEHNDLVRIEMLQQAVRVRVREHVEVLLQEQKLASVEVPLRDRLECDRDRILLLGLRDLLC